MKFRTLTRQVWPLALAAGFALASATALAQAPPAAAAPADEAEEEAAPAPEKKDEDLLKDVDIDKLDWSQLNVDASTLNMPSVKQRATAKSTASGDASWSSNAKGNGASSVSVKQSISPFWDTRVGADMTVVNPAPGTTSGDLLRQKISPNGVPENSSGSAWAAITAPGVGSIWDKTAIEARIDPAQEQSRIGTSLSKSVPLSAANVWLALEKAGVTDVQGVWEYQTRYITAISIKQKYGGHAKRTAMAMLGSTYGYHRRFVIIVDDDVVVHFDVQFSHALSRILRGADAPRIDRSRRARAADAGRRRRGSRRHDGDADDHRQLGVRVRGRESSPWYRARPAARRSPGRRRDRFRRVRRGCHRSRPQLLHGLPGLVAVDRAAARRKTCLHARAKPD
jgi:hypothetical protein